MDPVFSEKGQHLPDAPGWFLVSRQNGRFFFFFGGKCPAGISRGSLSSFLRRKIGHSGQSERRPPTFVDSAFTSSCVNGVRFAPVQIGSLVSPALVVVGPFTSPQGFEGRESRFMQYGAVKGPGDSLRKLVGLESTDVSRFLVTEGNATASEPMAVSISKWRSLSQPPALSLFSFKHTQRPSCGKALRNLRTGRNTRWYGKRLSGCRGIGDELIMCGKPEHRRGTKLK